MFSYVSPVPFYIVQYHRHDVAYVTTMIFGWYWSDAELRTELDDVIKWKHFPCYWPFLPGIHQWPVNSQHKSQWRGALMFSFICAWIGSWVNTRMAVDLRRQHAYYDVTVMNILNHTPGASFEISTVTIAPYYNGSRLRHDCNILTLILSVYRNHILWFKLDQRRCFGLF